MRGAVELRTRVAPEKDRKTSVLRNVKRADDPPAAAPLHLHLLRDDGKRASRSRETRRAGEPRQPLGGSFTFRFRFSPTPDISSGVVGLRMLAAVATTEPRKDDELAEYE